MSIITPLFENFPGNKRAMIRRDYQQGARLFGGHIFFQTLRTAIALGLLDLIETKGSMTLKDIAKTFKFDEQAVRIILLGLTSVEVLKKSGDYYTNSRMTKNFFLKNSPYKITAYIEAQHRIYYKGIYWLLESVQQNTNVGLKEFSGNEPTLYQRLAHDPETEKIFQQAMQELSNYANPQLRDKLDLSKTDYLVDVGGGNGTNAMALASKWPHIHATVFDSPSVCEIAKAHIQPKIMSDRESVIAGNCFVDPFPKETTALLFCHFLTIWSKEKNIELIKKSFESLPKGGQLIVFNMMQNDDESGPLSAAIGSPYFLSIATGRGMLYTWKEYESWMKDAGFSNVKRHILEFDHGIIIGTK